MGVNLQDVKKKVIIKIIDKRVSFSSIRDHPSLQRQQEQPNIIIKGSVYNGTEINYIKGIFRVYRIWNDKMPGACKKTKQ